VLRRLHVLEPWTESELEGACRQLAAEVSVRLVDLAQPIRLALTGRTASPPIFAVMADLGRETTLRRLRALRAHVPAGP
jgi:glutamyl-tRNA synthetase